MDGKQEAQGREAQDGKSIVVPVWGLIVLVVVAAAALLRFWEWAFDLISAL